MGDLDAKGLSCPRCGGPVHWIPGFRIDGTRYRKRVALKPSARRVAADDELVRGEPEGSGFAVRQGRKEYRHVVSVVCDRCHAAFSEAQCAGGKGARREG